MLLFLVFVLFFDVMNLLFHLCSSLWLFFGLFLVLNFFLLLVLFLFSIIFDDFYKLIVELILSFRSFLHCNNLVELIYLALDFDLKC